MSQGKIATMKIRTARRLRGAIAMPGDKSISHRAAMIAALAKGASRLHNFSRSHDCASTVRCLNQLGVSTNWVGNDLLVEGVGVSGMRPPLTALDCGNSGSTMRMLAGILAGQDFDSVLVGDHSLQARPMQRIIEPLSSMGANFVSNAGRPPLEVKGHRPLRPIKFDMPVASAQVKTSVLLAGLFANGRTEVFESS